MTRSNLHISIDAVFFELEFFLRQFGRFERKSFMCAAKRCKAFRFQNITHRLLSVIMYLPFFFIAFLCMTVANSRTDDLSDVNNNYELDDGPDSVTLSNNCPPATNQENNKIRREAACAVPRRDPNPELCPPLLKPVCCIGLPDELGSEIPDCWECKSSLVMPPRDCALAELKAYI